MMRQDSVIIDRLSKSATVRAKLSALGATGINTFISHLRYNARSLLTLSDVTEFGFEDHWWFSFSPYQHMSEI